MQRSPILASLLLGACGTLPHIEPMARTVGEQRATVVRLTSDCSEPDPFDATRDVSWAEPSSGTGVVISEKDVLTAGHVVGCAILPGVRVMLPSGRTYVSLVTRDARMFEDGTDLARVQAIGAYDRFEINVAPPRLGTPGYSDFVCIQPFGRDAVCGPIVGRHIIQAPTRPGDSGAPVYDVTGYPAESTLVGIVIAGDGNLTRYEPVDASWLEGT